MPDSFCCLVHENIYTSLLHAGLLCVVYLVLLFTVFLRSLSRQDLISGLILLGLLCLLGGRLILLNAGLSKKISQPSHRKRKS